MVTHEEGAPASSVDMKLTARRSPKLTPMPTVEVSPDVTAALGIVGDVFVEVEYGDTRFHAWLCAASPQTLARNKDVPLHSSAFLDRRTAQRHGISTDGDERITIRTHHAWVEVGPMLTEFPLHEDQVVLPDNFAFTAKPNTHFALIRSSTRAFMARVVHSDRYPVGFMRMRFSTRSLLELDRAGSGKRPGVLLLPSPGPERAGARLRAVASGIRTTLARVTLGAPEMSLALGSVSGAEDGIGVARCPQSALGLLGIDNGDRVRVRWGWRTSTVRVLAHVAEDSGVSRGLEVVGLGSGGAIEGQSNQLLLLPMGVRTRLGAPRDGVVVVRRSVTGLLGRRAVSLAIPIVGIAVSVPAIGLDWWAAALLVFVAAGLTLVGDRVPTRAKPVRHG